MLRLLKESLKVGLCCHNFSYVIMVYFSILFYWKIDNSLLENSSVRLSSVIKSPLHSLYGRGYVKQVFFRHGEFRRMEKKQCEDSRRKTHRSSQAIRFSTTTFESMKDSKERHLVTLWNNSERKGQMVNTNSKRKQERSLAFA